MVTLRILAVILLLSIFSQFLRFPSTARLGSEESNKKMRSFSTGGDLVFPYYDYMYEQMGKSSEGNTVARDPCADVQLANAGAVPKHQKGTLVLVTGGAGFIGSNLIDRLLELDYKVRIFDNLYTGFIRNVPLQSDQVEFYYGDILDMENLAKAVEGVDYIFHLAAMSKVVPSMKSANMSRFCTESNALGSWNVLEAARQSGSVKKVIYAASSTYYGNKPAPHREDMAPDFLTPYASSKYEGELQMQIFDKHFQVPTVSTRFFMVYGPRQPSTGAYAIVTGVFAKQAAQGTSLTIEGDGSHYRDFIHVRDIAEGLILAQQREDIRSDVVNLGTGTAYSVKDVADLVSSDQVHVAARENDLVGTLADTCKMKRLLGFKAAADFKTEMAYVARQTMKGNAFMQPWLTRAHSLSAPHLLPKDTPVFGWPRSQSDLDALLLAVNRQDDSDSKNQRHISVVHFSMSAIDSTGDRDLVLNTVFSLVRFGGVKSFIVAAVDDAALATCMELNLPCYDSRSSSPPMLVKDLVTRGYDVHYLRSGNSYVRDVLGSVLSPDKDIDVIGEGIGTEGEIYVRANDRTRAALAKWDQATNSESIFALSNWPAEFRKSNFIVTPTCVHALGIQSSEPFNPCNNQGYCVSVRCGPSSVSHNANETILMLKRAGVWHLQQCAEGKPCDLQQIVPLRWLKVTADLDTSGGFC